MTSSQGSPVRLSACAKLNLYLHVTGRRDDGFHLVDSLIAFADLADQLEIRPADGLILTVEGPFAAAAGPVNENLALRAAGALATAAGVSAGARLRLVKQIPAAAGLGGGSADAAAALRGLVSFWNIDPRGVDVLSLARSLGADVPACVDGGAAFVGGIGDRLEPAPRMPEAGLLLVNPGLPLPTPSVFAMLREDFSAPGRFAKTPESVRELAQILATRRNDLTAAAKLIAPAVGEVLAAIESLPGCRLARMSGSGATCFGLFDDMPSAKRAQSGLAGRRDWWTYAGRLMTEPCQ